jgi:hypothetical protein
VQIGIGGYGAQAENNQPDGIAQQDRSGLIRGVRASIFLFVLIADPICRI